jgi:hypothetical protein
MKLALISGIGFGALFFLSHLILTEHGVLARWLGHDPFPVGACVIAAAAAGYKLGETWLASCVHHS